MRRSGLRGIMEVLELTKVRAENDPTDISLGDGFPLSNNLLFDQEVWVIHRLWIEIEWFPFSMSVQSIKCMHFV